MEPKWYFASAAWVPDPAMLALGATRKSWPTRCASVSCPSVWVTQADTGTAGDVDAPADGLDAAGAGLLLCGPGRPEDVLAAGRAGAPLLPPPPQAAVTPQASAAPVAARIRHRVAVPVVTGRL